MKLFLTGVALGLALTFASSAEGRLCAIGAHHAHCLHQHGKHPHRDRLIVAPPPDVPFVPYESYYPPMPATLFDLPPDRDFLN
jgi:hypothetical protein